MPTDLLSPLVEAPAVNNTIELELDDHTLVIEQDRIRIGSSPLCEIVIPDASMLHSVIHLEDGVLWIEQDDESAEMLVNWRLCRRMALRDGDVISIGGVDITVRNQARTIEEQAARLVGDLTRLTADELCDRILSEQTVVTEFEEGRQRGWRQLLTAIKNTDSESMPVENDVDCESDECQRLLDQIREMSEMMTGRTQELDVCESELLAATALLQETQEQVSRQIEELLGQFADQPQDGELRASA